jgi:hypothetical protein
VDLAVDRDVTRLRGLGPNFDPARSGSTCRKTGGTWTTCGRRCSGAPGPPAGGRELEVAQRLMRGYEFADPSIVRAAYDPDEPLEGRTMLLELRFHGLRFHGGVRVSEVYDEELERQGRRARVWGWAYQTLEGHLEMGQMNWEVWKWLDSGPGGVPHPCLLQARAAAAVRSFASACGYLAGESSSLSCTARSSACAP